MLVCIMGDSCTGKSTIAQELAKQTGATVMTGNDYLRLAKDEQRAEAAFKKQAADACVSDHNLLYVITEKAQLSMIPDQALRILVIASLETIKERFTSRLGGNLPKPVELMLERKYGTFEQVRYDYKIDTDQDPIESAISVILERL